MTDDELNILKQRRIGDADRAGTVKYLNEMYAAGYINQEILDKRINQALMAEIGNDLERVTSDLPHDNVPVRVPASAVEHYTTPLEKRITSLQDWLDGVSGVGIVCSLGLSAVGSVLLSHANFEGIWVLIFSVLLFIIGCAGIKKSTP